MARDVNRLLSQIPAILPASAPSLAPTVRDRPVPTDPGDAPPATQLPPAGDTVDDWSRRAEALRARSDDAAASGLTVWSDVQLGAEPVADRALRSRLVAAFGAALATCSVEPIRGRPRVALVVTTPAGPVVTTFTAPHTVPPQELEALVEAAERQASAGHVDLRFLAAPDVTITAGPRVDRLALPVPRGALLAVGMGAVSARAVATPNGIGVRSVVTISATADATRFDADNLTTLVATAVASLRG
jgi:hypothetical protein